QTQYDKDHTDYNSDLITPRLEGDRKTTTGISTILEPHGVPPPQPPRPPAWHPGGASAVKPA
ncbi:MAG: hypothetical protein MUC69_09060, partial [Gemmatimonadales bacterium]|nr:hypothetical protein [Gemmatimonadales bacterium]